MPIPTLLIIVDFGMAFAPPPENESAEFKTKGQELGNRFLRLPEFAIGNRSPTATSDLTYLIGLLFFMITGRNPIQLLDENDRMPHIALADAIPDAITKDERWSFLQGVFDIGFQWRIDDRFQSAEQLEQLLDVLSGPGAPKGEARLAAARERLKHARGSDEVRLPELARAAIQKATQSLYQSLQVAARDEGLALDHNGFAMGERSGFPMSNMMLSIYDPKERKLGAMGHHSIVVGNSQFVATYQFEGGEVKEYFKGPILAPVLLERAVSNIVPDIISEAIERHTDKLKNKYQKQ